MTTFSVMHPFSGEAIATGLSLADAVDEKLSYDGRLWEIRNAGDCWQLWCKRLNMGWRATMIFSIEETETAARADIIQQAADAHWEREPFIVTDDVRERMELEAGEINVD